MHQIVKYFTDDDLYKFTMCCAVIENFPRAQVKYAFIDRNNTVYPPGFADELRRQIQSLETVVISDDEVDFMKKHCPYIPFWFYSFLKGFRYDSETVTVRQDDRGHLKLEIQGCWSNTILLEVKILAIISERYYVLTKQNAAFDMKKFSKHTYVKAERLIRGGCHFSDFGTRRRASFAAQDTAIATMTSCQSQLSGPGRFIGSSNVYLAMKYDLLPVGTMAHEFISAIGGMYGPQMANYLAMKAWSSTYRGCLGTFLYDTYGWNIFSLNFSEDYANMFHGLRVDSGDNAKMLEKIVNKYQSLGIDPATKQVIFSNALTTDDALEIQNFAQGKCIPAFGIGTHFTNDFEGINPMNIVIKLVAAKITESWPFFNETCKLSEDPDKHIGNPSVIRRFKEALHMD